MIDKKIITVVSGLPRSGTSMMMQIINEAGIHNYTDNKRLPDKSNPKGYAEVEEVKGLMKNNSFLQDAEGKSIKIVSPLIPFIDTKLNYQVVVMDRNLNEILSSQKEMLSKKVQNNDSLRSAFIKQQENAILFLESNKIPFIKISHKLILEQNKAEFDKLIEFINPDANYSILKDIVDKKLHRQKNIDSENEVTLKPAKSKIDETTSHKNDEKNHVFTINGKPFKVPPGGSLGLLAQGSIGVRAWKKAKQEWLIAQKT